MLKNLIIFILLVFIISCSYDTNLLVDNTYWKSSLNNSWYIQLDGKLNMNNSVDIYIIDLFDNSKETIDILHKKDIKVICYFSAGSYEPWRPDIEEFPKVILGNSLIGFETEKWLDISKPELITPIILKRLNLAVIKGCDGIDVDNIDSYTNDNGFNLTYTDQLLYNIWLSNEAHKRNLSIGLKNDMLQIPLLVNNFDFAINEQCFYFNECDNYYYFITQNKPVFNIEYNLDLDQFCNKSISLKFNSLKLNNSLDGSFLSCK